ncbi:hypothetical protein E2C01_029945 [Portunus trituberculatus]|uniref:Uncharacterized protein n=1 Tax=Portunus trituberculatus TaxID=210409 RepID=A0A5B7ESW3_PORTR|nr:hypothetical protein [Portunus trituberculatus]
MRRSKATLALYSLSSFTQDWSHCYSYERLEITIVNALLKDTANLCQALLFCFQPAAVGLRGREDSDIRTTSPLEFFKLFLDCKEVTSETRILCQCSALLLEFGCALK